MTEYYKFFSPFFWVKFIVSPKELVKQEKENASEKTGLFVLIFFSALFAFLIHAAKFAFFAELNFAGFFVDALSSILGFFIGASAIYFAAKFFGAKGGFEKIFYLLVLISVFSSILSLPFNIVLVFFGTPQSFGQLLLSQPLLVLMFSFLVLAVSVYSFYLQYLAVREIFSLPVKNLIISVLWLQALFVALLLLYFVASGFFSQTLPAAFNKMGFG